MVIKAFFSNGNSVLIDFHCRLDVYIFKNSFLIDCFLTNSSINGKIEQKTWQEKVLDCV